MFQNEIQVFLILVHIVEAEHVGMFNQFHNSYFPFNLLKNRFAKFLAIDDLHSHFPSSDAVDAHFHEPGLSLAERLLEPVGPDVLEVVRVSGGRAWLRRVGSGLSVGTRRHGSTCPGVSSRRLGARGQNHGAGPRVAGRSPGPARYRLGTVPRCAREPPRAAMLACRFACCRRALRRRGEGPY